MNAPTPDRYRWSYKGVTFDFYRLCEILGITHHAQAHALKKVIRAGRSIKPVTQDIDETIDALRRWKEMIGEDKTGEATGGPWVCQHCKTEQKPDHYRYQVREKHGDPWIKPACSECARKMLSEGPFHTAKLES